MKRKHFLWIAMLMACMVQVLPQGREVSGRVIHSLDSLPLFGVSVVLRGTPLGTASDKNGAFTIQIPEHYHEYHILCFTCVGMLSQEVEISQALREQVHVTMEEEFVPLPEVTIVHDTLTGETRTYLSTYRPDTVIHVLVQIIDSLQSVEGLRDLR
jgi:hypothetical protein